MVSKDAIMALGLGLVVFFLVGGVAGIWIGFLAGMIAASFYMISQGENYKRRKEIRKKEAEEERHWRRQSYHKEKGSRKAREDFREEEKTRKFHKKHPLGSGGFGKSIFR